MSIGQLTNLRVLDMRINDINLVSILIPKAYLPSPAKKIVVQQVPGSLGGLISLRELNLSNNRLTSIPASLVELPSLSSLKLAANRLEVRFAYSQRHHTFQFNAKQCEYINSSTGCSFWAGTDDKAGGVAAVW